MRTATSFVLAASVLFALGCGGTKSGFGDPDGGDGGGGDSSVNGDGGCAFCGIDSGKTDGGGLQYGCSGDLRNVIDGNGNVVQTCPDDQGCAGGQCVPACQAAGASKGSVGCDYVVPTPSFYSGIGRRASRSSSPTTGRRTSTITRHAWRHDVRRDEVRPHRRGGQSSVVVVGGAVDGSSAGQGRRPLHVGGSELDERRLARVQLVDEHRRHPAVSQRTAPRSPARARRRRSPASAPRGTSRPTCPSRCTTSFRTAARARTCRAPSCSSRRARGARTTSASSRSAETARRSGARSSPMQDDTQVTVFPNVALPSGTSAARSQRRPRTKPRRYTSTPASTSSGKSRTT